MECSRSNAKAVPAGSLVQIEKKRRNSEKLFVSVRLILLHSNHYNCTPIHNITIEVTALCPMREHSGSPYVTLLSKLVPQWQSVEWRTSFVQYAVWSHVGQSIDIILTSFKKKILKELYWNRSTLQNCTYGYTLYIINDPYLVRDIRLTAKSVRLKCTVEVWWAVK